MYNVNSNTEFTFLHYVRFYSPSLLRPSFSNIKPHYIGAWQRECRKAIHPLLWHITAVVIRKMKFIEGDLEWIAGVRGEALRQRRRDCVPGGKEGVTRNAGGNGTNAWGC